MRNVFTLFFADITCILFSIVLAILVMLFIGGPAAFYLLIALFAITNVSDRLNAYKIAEGMERP